MYERLTQIDSSVRGDHFYLTEEDVCLFFGEYTARRGFSHSDTNQLISNLKKSVNLQGQQQYIHKTRAIKTVAKNLSIIPNPQNFTFIPIPSSKTKDHPLYDDRLIKILEAYKSSNPNVDFREVVLQTQTTRASHECADGHRLTSTELEEIYTIDESTVPGIRPILVIFDDMITTGNHFKAMQTTLKRRFPDAQIIGLFISRRVNEAENPFDVFDDLSS